MGRNHPPLSPAKTVQEQRQEQKRLKQELQTQLDQMEEVPIKVVCYLDTLVSGLFQKRELESEVVLVQLREYL